MKKILALLIGDFKNFGRDPILLITIFVPFLVAFLARFGLPALSHYLIMNWEVNIIEHYPFILSIIILLTPMMVGTLLGLNLLDERDENTLVYYSVTPITKSGYLIYKTILPCILSFIITFAATRISQLTSINYISFIPVALMTSLQAPAMAFFLSTYANNKVEGFAFSKGMGILYVAPVAGYFLQSNWKYIFGLLPPYWVTMSFINSFEINYSYYLHITLGIFIHIFYLLFFFKRFSAKID